MAKYAAPWGIDVGQCAFKALRCKLKDGVVVADAFDYIEYPKILSQPDDSVVPRSCRATPPSKAAGPSRA